MDSDVHLPEEYGIYQSVGDTVGPSGIIRALRTIPMMFEIADAKELFNRMIENTKEYLKDYKID